MGYIFWEGDTIGKNSISLCNVSYKIISKIMVKRLWKILSDIIGPYQGAFIVNRQIQDNVLIAHEIFHDSRKKKGKIGYMTLKLDMEKAYDRVEWNFILKSL